MSLVFNRQTAMRAVVMVATCLSLVACSSAPPAANVGNGPKGEAEILSELQSAESNAAVNAALASNVNRLAQTYAQQADYDKAEKLVQRLVDLCKNPRVNDEKNLSLALNNLGVLYLKRGKYGKAEQLLQESLVLQQRVLGPLNPAFADGITNLATLYYEQGRYADALPLFTRAVEIYKAGTGAELKPQLSKTLNNLANCYSHQKDFKKAERLFGESLALDEQLLGKDSKELAPTLNNLAYTYEMQERFGEAEPILERALKLAEQAYGPNSLELVGYLDNYSYLLRKTNRLDEGKKIKERAQAILIAHNK